MMIIQSNGASRNSYTPNFYSCVNCSGSHNRNKAKCAFSRSFYLLKDVAKIQTFLDMAKKSLPRTIETPTNTL